MQSQDLLTSYQAFNAKFDFEAKAEFALTELQWKDVQQFRQWRFSLNRYEVGGGKTVVSTVVSLLDGAETTLVIVLPILIKPWVEWLERFGEVLEYSGDKHERKQIDPTGVRWVVMSHGIFRRDFEKLYAAFKGKHVDTIIDEAHWLKNIESVLYQYTGVMTNRPKGSLQMLTGTPTSKPEDIYAYLRLMRTTWYRNYQHFENSHVAERAYMGKETVYKNLDILAHRFDSRSIVRTKEEVHGYNIKPLFPNTSYQLSDEHMAFYTQVMEEQLVELPDGGFIDATTANKLYHLAQQLIVNWGYFTENPKHISTAYELIDTLIELNDPFNKANSKLIIWTQYKITSRSVLNYLSIKYKVKVAAAYSEVDSAAGAQAFMHDPDTRLGVFQYQSAGAGLNPQHVCWDNLFLETNTVPLYNIQAMGRTDRVGQKHIPLMRFARADGTIQTGLLENLLRKDDTLNKVERTKKSLRALLLGGNLN